jgi:thioredoxin-like negative regulator of GroEL
MLGSAVVFFLALMSKENAITFLAVVPLALYCFTKTKTFDIVKATLPYFGMTVVFLVIRSSVLGEAAGIGEEAQELMNNPFVGLSANERYGTIFYTLGKYIQLLVFPHPLTHDYYPKHIEVMDFSNWQVLLSLVTYIGLGIYALIRLPKRDPIAFGIIYFIATLSIVSNLVFSVGTNMSERLVFMPSVGFCLILSILIDKLLKNQTAKWFVIGAIALLFMVKTISRNTAWKDNYTLFATDIKTSVNSAKLNNAMGGVTIEEANKLPDNDPKKAQMFNEAIGYLTKATQIHPTYANAYLLTGNAFYYQKNYDKAAEFFRYIAQNFDNPNGKNNLFETGKRLTEEKQFAKAIPILEEAKAYLPANVDLLGNLAAAYAQTNQHLKAIENFAEVLKIEPNNAKAHLYTGYSYMSLASTNPSYKALGEQFIQKAKQIDPNVK